MSSSRWHRLTHEGETPVTQPKWCASLMPLMKQCALALMKQCALTTVIISNDACVVEPKPPFLWVWASSSTKSTLF